MRCVGPTRFGAAGDEVQLPPLAFEMSAVEIDHRAVMGGAGSGRA